MKTHPGLSRAAQEPHASQAPPPCLPGCRPSCRKQDPCWYDRRLLIALPVKALRLSAVFQAAQGVALHRPAKASYPGPSEPPVVGRSPSDPVLPLEMVHHPGDSWGSGASSRGEFGGKLAEMPKLRRGNSKSFKVQPALRLGPISSFFGFSVEIVKEQRKKKTPLVSSGRKGSTWSPVRSFWKDTHNYANMQNHRSISSLDQITFTKPVCHCFCMIYQFSKNITQELERKES